MKKNRGQCIFVFYFFSLFFNLLFSGNEPSIVQKITFFKLIESGDLKKVKKLYKKNNHLLFQKNHLEKNALHIALEKGYQKIINFLLKKKVPLNEQDSTGETPLHYAIGLNNFSLVHRLIDAGADINLSSYDGFTSLHYAAAVGNLSIILLLLSEGIFDINAKTEDGYTALYCAQYFKHQDTIQFLLKKGIVN